ncbi:uncharacterized protein BO80DRAFT_141794 [Aspergillus ibericus CBS 121593]|uniref:Secreted protein n=1 Tax=Aspergillus ibericus CBS 121593 TaxID=1448316 RepID=A0A395GUQ1_9EURO|nr:hypothetical protein BO80DRAFT_141794 [Aspergillus ibericus CBS 121593]RAK99235.1 hypothetical protein BO80DRAFT_141794 [Aspergillus ibericus CBS 121593]
MTFGFALFSLFRFLPFLITTAQPLKAQDYQILSIAIATNLRNTAVQQRVISPQRSILLSPYLPYLPYLRLTTGWILSFARSLTVPCTLVVNTILRSNCINQG